MKMEHINENTIKVMIGKSDLEERGLTFFDLLGNQHEVESFFYSILEEVGVKHEFEGIDAVTFQVVPRAEGLDLYITKGLNDNLKQYIRSSMDAKSSEDSATPLDQVMKYLENETKSSQSKRQTASKKVVDSKKIPDYQIFVFDEFTDYVGFVHRVKKEEVGENALFHFDGQYYWGQRTTKPEFLEKIHYRAVEHGDLSPISFYVIKEHGQTIMANDAIALTQKHFK